MGNHYSGSTDNYAFSDADYVGDVQSRRSTPSYISTLGDGAIT